MDPYLGEIRMFGGNYAPAYWALCNGAILTVSGNDALFSLIGTTYGGNGTINFGLPDMRGRIPVHQGAGPGLTQRIMGQMMGTETVTLTETQIPAHSHPLQATTNPVNTDDPTNSITGTPAYSFYDDSQDTKGIQAMSDKALLSEGGSQAHQNIMPSLCINFIICLQGIYPSRN